MNAGFPAKRCSLEAGRNYFFDHILSDCRDRAIMRCLNIVPLVISSASKA